MCGYVVRAECAILVILRGLKQSGHVTFMAEISKHMAIE